MVSEARVAKYFEIRKSVEPVWLTEKLVWLGGIPKINDFEVQRPFKKIRNGNQDDDDYMEDEIALAYKSADGLVVINACSHRGICNTIEYAKRVCNDDRVADVIGGFHLLNPEKELLDKTVEYFSKNQPKAMHTCHCTDFQSKVALSNVAKLQEVGSGLQLDYR